MKKYKDGNHFQISKLKTIINNYRDLKNLEFKFANSRKVLNIMPHSFVPQFCFTFLSTIKAKGTVNYANEANVRLKNRCSFTE